MSTTPNPYVGPRSFETGEPMYGRDRELRALSALLISERIVLLHSPSGAGKTSLLRAGLLPYLISENFNVLPLVRVNINPPKEAPATNRYLFSTMLTLEEAFPVEERLPVEKLVTLSLDEYLDQRAPKNDTLLVFDQFEEVLTISPSDREEKQVFFNSIGTALRDKKRWALFSMREDYLGALTPYLRPLPNRLATRFRLDLLGVDAAIQAVQKPSQAAGVDFTQQAAQKLIDDLRSIQVQLPDGSLETQLGSYVEPVQLQVVCYRLWENRDPQDKNINIKDLEKVGDVNESLASYYASSTNRAAETSGIPERSIREWFERKLITADNIRGQVRMGLETSEGLPNNVVRLLENAHIIRADQRSGQTWFELAHDRLIEPIRSDNKTWFKRNLSLFQRQATLWLERERSEGLLLRGRELEIAEQESKQIKTTADEDAFLQACRLRRKREQRDQTQQRLITIALFISLGLIGIAVYASIRANNATAEQRLAVLTAQSASTQAYNQQVIAQSASTQAVFSANAAYAASTEAYIQKASAEKSRNEAVANANIAATAQANALAEKAKANQQEQKALEESRLAQANALVSQAILAQFQNGEPTANLMAAAAFEIRDTIQTRIQLLVSLANKNMLYLTQSLPSGQTIDMSFASDGTKLITSDYFDCLKNNHFSCGSGVVKIWNISSATKSTGEASVGMKQQTGQIKPQGFLDAFAVSPDGQTIATASCDPVNTNITICEQENILFWDINSHEKSQQSLSFHAKIFNEQAVHLLYSPDGSMLAMSYNNPTVFKGLANTNPGLVLWDVQSGKEKSRLETGPGITQMAFSPDGKTLAYTSGMSLVLLDINTLGSTVVPSPGATGNLFSLAYSPDGKILALGGANGIITLLDTSTNQRIGTPLLSTSKVLSLSFSPDNLMLVSGHFDAGIIYWDVATGIKYFKKPNYKHVETPDAFPIYALTFNPSGKMLASSSNEIILWDLSTDSWRAKACEIAKRNFSLNEWQINFPGEDYRLTCPAFPAGK